MTEPLGAALEALTEIAVASGFTVRVVVVVAEVKAAVSVGVNVTESVCVPAGRISPAAGE